MVPTAAKAENPISLKSIADATMMAARDRALDCARSMTIRFRRSLTNGALGKEKMNVGKDFSDLDD